MNNTYIYPEHIKVTMNNMGVSTTIPNELTEEFFTWVDQVKGNHLDIGAAYGISTIPALKKGAKVTAIDLSQAHLDILEKNCPKNLKKNLVTQVGRLPNTFQFSSNTFDGIHISQVFHFLRGEEIEKSISLAHQWLKPGGKIFVIAATPYGGIFTDNLLSYYNERKNNNMTWPGEIENIMDFANHPVVQNLSPFFHVIEDTFIKKAFEKQGFIVEKCEMLTIENLPEYARKDGKETVQLIASKSVK